MTTAVRTLLRLLFPSWAFFDVARLPPALYTRRTTGKGQHTTWEAAILPDVRRWWHVLFHPAGTSTLAAQTLVERWAAEHDDDGPDAPSTHLSLAILEQIAAQALIRQGIAPTERWQFRIACVSDGSVDILWESEVLTSPRSDGTRRSTSVTAL